MRDLVFIRTHAFGENERSLYKTLRLFFPEEAVVVCADESKAQVDTGGIAKISLTRDIASRLAGGDLPEDWGWRMGDLFYARVREVHPDVGRYWLIEPDVHIPPGHVAAILGDLAEIEADYLACDFRDHRIGCITRGRSGSAVSTARRSLGGLNENQAVSKTSGMTSARFSPVRPAATTAFAMTASSFGTGTLGGAGPSVAVTRCRSASVRFTAAAEARVKAKTPP